MVEVSFKLTFLSLDANFIKSQVFMKFRSGLFCLPSARRIVKAFGQVCPHSVPNKFSVRIHSPFLISGFLSLESGLFILLRPFRQRVCFWCSLRDLHSLELRVFLLRKCWRARHKRSLELWMYRLMSLGEASLVLSHGTECISNWSSSPAAKA